MVGEPRQPSGLEKLNSRPFLFYIGTDYRHKNRCFALRLLKALRERHGWDGGLVFAGAHVSAGSSAGDEAEYLAIHSELDKQVVDLGAVNEAEKAWLYSNAAAVAYPTIYEGFGVLPFEAAQAGVPSLFASQSSLAELLPSRLALLVPWDAETSADRSIEVLQDGAARSQQVKAIQAAAASHTWNRVALETRNLYERVWDMPLQDARMLRSEFSRRSDELEPRLEELRQRTELDMYDHIDWALIGPDGVLKPELRRAMLAIGKRRVLRAIFYWPLLAMYKITYFVKNAGRSRKQSDPGT